MQRQSLEAVLREMNNAPYLEQYEYIKAQLEAGKLKPVKSSGKNGKKPVFFKIFQHIKLPVFKLIIQKPSLCCRNEEILPCQR